MNGLRVMLLIAFAFVIAPSLAVATSSKELRAKYTGKRYFLQYNLYHDEEGKAVWVNYIAWPAFVPIGRKVTVRKIDSDEAILQIEGMEDEIELEIEDATPDEDTVMSRLLGDSAPSLEGLEPADLKGIKAGQIREGMSRKGVLLAVGPPPEYYAPPFRTKCINRDLEADQFCYAKSIWDYFLVNFEEGRVISTED